MQQPLIGAPSPLTQPGMAVKKSPGQWPRLETIGARISD